MADSPANGSQFRWYLAGVGAWFLAFGIQMVMFAYLVTTVLQAPANQIGLAQASPTLVSTFLLIVGGAVADQVDTRRLMMLCHAVAILPAIGLAAIVWTGALRYEWLILYGLFMGLVTSFMLPSREAMMGDVIVDHTHIQRAVTSTLGITFMAQIAGMLLARLAAVAGAAPIILLQAVAQIVGVFASYNLAPSTRHHVHAEANRAGQLQRIRASIREVVGSHALLPVNIMTLGIGVLFIGSFLVILPVLLREEFGGDVEQFSTLQVAFWGGTIVSSILMSRMTIVHRGRMIVGAVAMGTVVLALVSIKAPLAVLYALVFVWGMGAGVTIAMSRTTVQEHAPAAHRARILSIYQLGFTGGMAVGALVIGFIVHELGPRQAALVPAAAMALVLVGVVSLTKIWHITALRHGAGAT